MKISELLESNGEQKDFGAPIYHGTRRLKAGIHKQILRTKPKSTYRPIHNSLSKLSKEKFGIDVRALTFCTMVKRNVKPYGKAFELLPIGNYRVFVVDGTWDMTMINSFLHQGYEDGIMNILEKHLDIVSYSLKDLVQSFLLGLDMNQHETTWMEAGNELIELFIEHQKEDSPMDELSDEDEAIVQEIKAFFQRIEKKIRDYIDQVKEVKHANEIEKEASELMLYLPDGFELLSVED